MRTKGWKRSTTTCNRLDEVEKRRERTSNNGGVTEIWRLRSILPKNGKESKIDETSELIRPATRFFPHRQTDVKAPCGFVEDILGESGRHDCQYEAECLESTALKWVEFVFNFHHCYRSWIYLLAGSMTKGLRWGLSRGTIMDPAYCSRKG